MSDPIPEVKIGDRVAVWFYVTDIGEHDVFLSKKAGRVGYMESEVDAPVSAIALIDAALKPEGGET